MKARYLIKVENISIGIVIIAMILIITFSVKPYLPNLD